MSLLTALLLADAVGKGGPGSGPRMEAGNRGALGRSVMGNQMMGGPKPKGPKNSLSVHYDPSIQRFRIKDSTGKNFGGVWRSSSDALKEAGKIGRKSNFTPEQIKAIHVHEGGI